MPVVSAVVSTGAREQATPESYYAWPETSRIACPVGATAGGNHHERFAAFAFLVKIACRE